MSGSLPASAGPHVTSWGPLQITLFSDFCGKDRRCSALARYVNRVRFNFAEKELVMTKKTRVVGSIIGGCAVVAAAVLLTSPAEQAGDALDSVHATGCPVPVRLCHLPAPGGPSA